MKKRIVIILIVIGLLAVLFTPIPTGVCNDGGTRVYSALTYKIVDWNRLTGESTYSKTRAYFFPENFKSIDTLWEMEFIETLSSFKAFVLEINENSVLVEPVKGESERQSSDKISFSIANLEKIDVKVGSTVIITYNGEIMESYPAQIVATKWEIYHNESQETRFMFDAQVLEINENSVLVRPSAGSDISGVDKVEFSTANLPELDIKVGSIIKVIYNGQVMYSYPAQINALEWEMVG